MEYLTIFIAAIVFIPIITYCIFYYIIVPSWKTHSQDSFHDVKETLVRFGNLSEKESQSFLYNNISKKNDPKDDYLNEAIRLAQLDLSGGYLILKIILPLLFVILSFIFFTFRFWMPGITKKVRINGDTRSSNTSSYLSQKTLDFLNDLNKVIITVDGFLISILVDLWRHRD